MLLRIGHLSTFYHTAIILTARADTNSRLGAEIDWRPFGAGPAIVDAFDRQGRTHIAYIGLPSCDYWYKQRCKYNLHCRRTCRGNSDFRQKELKGFPDEADMNNILSQIKGGKIGVQGKGSIHDVILQDCLERFNLKSEIAIINFQWVDMVLCIFYTGFGQAAVPVFLKSNLQS